MAQDYRSQLQQAADHIAAHDPILAPIIHRAGLPTFEPHREYYRELAGSVISQQLSVKAAATIERRFRDLFGGTFPEPAAILQKSAEELHTAGLSRAKVAYVQDLARHLQEGTIHVENLDTLNNEAIITQLTSIKGIGVWTAHMFLIFCMGRLDVLPVGDLGIRNGIQKLYGLAAIPSTAEIEVIAARYEWHPYQSVASWYIWHSLDNAPKLTI